MARIQTGALPISADLRRLEVDTEDDEAVEALRAHCPTREGDEEIDMTVARNLLEDPVLYARALHSVAAPAAHAHFPPPASGPWIPPQKLQQSSRPSLPSTRNNTE